MDDRVTNIEFRKDGVLQFRWVLEPHRQTMYEMEKEMEDAGCEPLLVTDSHNSNVWWTDDITFICDCMTQKMVDRPFEEAFFRASEHLTLGSTLRMGFEGRVIEAKGSSVPMDRKHGWYTDDCVPLGSDPRRFKGVEWCPYCECEHEYDVGADEWTDTCRNCGAMIILCDKCMQVNGRARDCAKCKINDNK